GRDLKRGVLLLTVELADRRRQYTQRRRWQRAHAHDVADRLLFAVERLTGGIEGIENFNGMRQELFTHESKLSAQTAAIEQAGSGKLFQFVQRFG
ncbi:hypothetical protein NS24R_21850, partial [Enterobacter hormaechei subsp. xiangfangensis]